MTVLRTSRLTLRPPVPSDWPAFRAFMLSDRSTVFGSHGDEGRAFRAFAAELGHWQIKGFGMFAVTWARSDEAIALVGPWNPPDWPETEVGWMVLAPEAEGTGVAFEAAQAAVAHAFRDLGWATCVSYIAPDNLRSQALARRLGAVLDPAAPLPALDKAVEVWRHPRPAAEAAA